MTNSCNFILKVDLLNRKAPSVLCFPLRLQQLLEKEFFSMLLPPTGLRCWLKQRKIKNSQQDYYNYTLRSVCFHGTQTCIINKANCAHVRFLKILKQLQNKWGYEHRSLYISIEDVRYKLSPALARLWLTQEVFCFFHFPCVAQFPVLNLILTRWTYNKFMLCVDETQSSRDQYPGYS